MMLSEGNGEPICGGVVRQMTTDCAHAAASPIPRPGDGTSGERGFSGLPAQRLLILLSNVMVHCARQGRACSLPLLHHSLVRREHDGSLMRHGDGGRKAQKVSSRSLSAAPKGVCGRAGDER